VNSNRKSGWKGFTLFEMLVSLIVGTLVLGAAVDLFSRSVNATWVASQKAEMQQDARAAINLMTKDIRLAGAGLPSGGVALANGTGTVPAYGIDYNSVGHLGANNNAAITFPILTGSTIPYLYGVIPGCGAGVTPTGAAAATDIISVAYTDSTFPWQNYSVTFNNAQGTSITFTDNNPASDPGINNPGLGLQQGDLVLFTSKIVSGTTTTSSYALADVTAPAGAGSGPTYTVGFANNDPMKVNQTAATANDIEQIANNVGSVSTSTTATRIWLITYYLWNKPNPAGGAAIPVLMRQVNARTPVPVTENVVNMQFAYDTYDSTGNLVALSCNAGMPTVSPTEIRQINITHLTFRSELAGANSSYRATKGYQTVDLAATLSARNLSFSQRY
jgi:prepilin-type N-terminal cleavage/methylation domain-containing protein